MLSFPVGTRVEVVVQQQHFHTVGLLGTVVVDENNETYPGSVGVQHDVEFQGGHTCDSHCPDGFGLWYQSPNLKLRIIDDEIPVVREISDLFFGG